MTGPGWVTWVDAGARGLIRKAVMRAFERKGAMLGREVGFVDVLEWAKDMAAPDVVLLAAAWRRKSDVMERRFQRHRDEDDHASAMLLSSAAVKALDLLKRPAEY